jgi:hypothetical protein
VGRNVYKKEGSGSTEGNNRKVVVQSGCFTDMTKWPKRVEISKDQLYNTQRADKKHI